MYIWSLKNFSHRIMIFIFNLKKELAEYGKIYGSKYDNELYD
jgi:hypothetical protein